MSYKSYNGNINSSYDILYVDGSEKNKSTMIERCPLCNGTKRNFHCNKCIKAGNFFRSKSDSKICFEDKKDSYNKSKEYHQELQYRLNKTLSIHEFYASKKSEKLLLEFNIKHLKLKIENFKNLIKKRQEYLDELKSRKKQTELNSNLMILKLERIKKHLEGSPQRLDINVLNLKRNKFDLMKCRQDHIKNLIKDIFPIKIVSNRESHDTSNNPCINLLSEARNTEYIKGEWVLSKSDQNTNQIYQIIEALLPASGLNFKEKFKYEGNRNLNSSKSISAALCLLSQIVSIGSIILGAHLSSNMPLKDFILPSANSKIFSKCITKLNSNILQLCELQHINFETIVPGQPIINLFKMLDSPRLGSDDPLLMNNGDMQNSTAETESLQLLDESSDSNEDDVNAVFLDNCDWEYVNSTLPEAEMSVPGQNSTSYFSSTILQNGQTELHSTVANLASGLVNSASLLWKGWSTKPDL